GRINDDARPGVVLQRGEQQIALLRSVTLLGDVAQVWTMKAGDVAIRVVEAQLIDDVVANAAGGAGGECRNWILRKCLPESAELAIVGTKFVSPFGNAMSFINREKRQRNALKPVGSVGARQPLGPEIQQAKGA